MNDTATKIEELQAKIDTTLKKALVYKDCTDGSYKACLYHNGYYDLVNQLKQLKEN
jgi:hypothetical protein